MRISDTVKRVNGVSASLDRCRGQSRRIIVFLVPTSQEALQSATLVMWYIVDCIIMLSYNLICGRGAYRNVGSLEHTLLNIKRISKPCDKMYCDTIN